MDYWVFDYVLQKQSMEKIICQYHALNNQK